MNNNNISTIIILDWDDTLFPTSWVIKNNINLLSKKHVDIYTKIFTKLDGAIFNLLKSLEKYGTVMLVTNALPSWVYISAKVLPKTQSLLENIYIYSARQLYQEYYDDMMEWKKRTFEKIIKKHVNSNEAVNIISIGDADYEKMALVELYNLPFLKNKKILKTIKLMRSPTLKHLIDQLTVLNKASNYFCTSNDHIDWNFKINNKTLA